MLSVIVKMNNEGCLFGVCVEGGASWEQLLFYRGGLAC